MNTSMVHVDSTTLLVNEIKDTRRRLAHLEKELMVRLEKKDRGGHGRMTPDETYPYENDISLIILVVAALSLFFVMKSGVIMKPDVSMSEVMMTTSESKTAAREANCGRFNGDSAGCVDGQKQGNGCAWWSDCRRCYDNRLKGAEVICK